MANVLFLESGTDATQDLSFYSFTFGTVASDTGQSFTGPRSIKCTSPASPAQAGVERDGVIADAGRRISVRFRFDRLPDATSGTISFTSASADIFRVNLRTDGKIDWVPVGATTVTGTKVLSANTWYRISIAYTITNTTTFKFACYIDGVKDATCTAGTLTGVSTAFLDLSIRTPHGPTANIWYDDVYVDDGTDYADPGNIRVTSKRPNANGTLNEFGTQIGSGGSGYGTGHSPQVNEQPLSITNGWSVVNSGSIKTEEYNVEGQATGDVDITGANSIVDILGWVYAKSLTAETGKIIVNGVSTNVSLTSTATLFRKAAGTPGIYPAGTGTDIGLSTDTTVTTVSLYECGILIAYYAYAPPTFDYPNTLAKTTPGNLTWLNPLDLRLRNQDKFFGAAGESKTYDWPNPRGPTYPSDLRTFADPLKLNLASKDKFFTSPGRGPTYDWPNPRGYPYPIDGRTWLQPLTLNLLNKDKFFAAPGESPRYDWPNPTRSPYFPLYSQQVSRLYDTPVFPVTLPFNEYDWPNPQVSIPRRPIPDWTLRTNPAIYQSGKPFNQQDWPNPRGYTPPVDVRTWTVSLNLNLLVPFSQMDWPNPPRGYVQPIENKTWLETLNQLQLGKDKFFAAPGEAPRYDYPNPRGANRSVDLYGYTGSFNPNLSVQIVQKPFNKTDWPNPRSAARGQDWTLAYNSTFFPPSGQFIADTPTIANVIGVQNSAFLLLAAASTRVSPQSPFTEAPVLTAQSTREIVNNSGTKLVIFTANDRKVGD